MAPVLQLLAIGGSAIATVVALSFRIGQFEARVMQRLDDHDRRLSDLERARLGVHGFV